jgi:hypothetical protein
MTTKIPIPDNDYNVLDQYVKAVVRRHKENGDDTDAIEAIMHPLAAALFRNTDQEFIPYMKSRLSQWKSKNA